MINRERLVKKFMDLVRIDSETGNETEIAEKLKQELSELGLSIEEDNTKMQTGHGANNLIGTLPGHGSGTSVFFGTHMDTVCPGKKIQPSVHQDYIVSDGTTILGSDDKAGIAALLEALCVIKEERLAHADIQVIFTVGEESGLIGAKALDPKWIKADFGFELDSEGPVGSITVAAPYQAKLMVDLFGKTAHAGIAPETGISAITMAAKAISRMPLGRIDEETTANIGRFEGGKATNVVCDYVRILAEARSLIREKLDRQIQKMTLAWKHTAEEMGGSANIRTTYTYPGYRFSADDPAIRLARRAVESIGRTVRLVQSGGGSDANIISGKGIPTVNLGIGYKNIHTTKEKIAVAELEKAAELVLALVRQASTG